MPAIHDNRRAGHVAPRLGRQQQQGPVEFPVFAKPAEGDPLAHRLARFGIEILVIDRGLVIARRDGVHADAIACILQRHVTRQVVDACLRDAISRGHELGPVRRDRGDVDDRSLRPCRDHGVRRMLADAPDAGEVGIHHRVPVCLALFAKPPPARHARIVDHDVARPPEGFPDRIERGNHAAVPGHIHFDRQGLAPLGGDVGGHVLQPVHPSRGDHNGGACPRQHMRKMLAQPARGPRHQCRPVSQTKQAHASNLQNNSCTAQGLT